MICCRELVCDSQAVREREFSRGTLSKRLGWQECHHNFHRDPTREGIVPKWTFLAGGFANPGWHEAARQSERWVNVAGVTDDKPWSLNVEHHDCLALKTSLFDIMRKGPDQPLLNEVDDSG